MSKEKVYDETIELEKINTALENLDILSIDKFVSNFYTTNSSYYTKYACKIKVIPTKSYSISSKNKSKFNIEFIPSYISPTEIVMKLTNLDGNSSKKVNIKLGENTKVIYSTIISDEINNMKKIHKARVETNYKNSKKSYKKTTELFINEKDCNDYTKEETIYYSDLDDSYVKSIISIGTSNSLYPTSIKYYKGSNISEEQISDIEFKASIKDNNNKVLKKVCK